MTWQRVVSIVSFVAGAIGAAALAQPLLAATLAGAAAAALVPSQSKDK